MKEIMAIVRINMMNKDQEGPGGGGHLVGHRPGRPGEGQGSGGPELAGRRRKRLRGGHRPVGQTQRLIPKRIFFVVVPDRLVKKTVQTIIAVNRTGKSGDGKIFVMPVMDSVRVRTAESGDQVLDEA